MRAWRCAVRHNHLSIRDWLENRLGYFGITAGDIASPTMDSGTSVSKAIVEMTAGWVPCEAHLLHIAVRHALSGSDESADERAALPAKGGTRA